MEIRKANHRKSNINTKTYVKNPKKKTTEKERDFTIMMAITMVIFLCVRVSGLN